MVITRQENATVEANPSVTKFSKEQNDLKMKGLQEYAANNAVYQYHLFLCWTMISATPRIQLQSLNAIIKVDKITP